MIRPALAILVPLALAACAPSTADALRKEASGQKVFEVDQNYQAVYRTVVGQARKCYQTGMITAQMVVQGDLYTDLRSGHVVVALHGGFGVDTHLASDITALDDKRTRVVTYHALSTWEPNARAVEQWVKDGSADCQPRSNPN